MVLAHEGRSDVGRRGNNEDRLLARPDLGLFAVADGMGGYEGGEIASRLALGSLERFFEQLDHDGLGMSREASQAEERLRLAVRIADRKVRRRAVGRLAQMGTTVACVAVEDDMALVAHVGDSRVYRLREGELRQLTYDHSAYAQLRAGGATSLRRGEHPLGHLLTQSLGAGPAARPDVRLEVILPGDRFLLCTDGLSDVLDDEEIAWQLTRTEGAADALVDAAYDRGSQDNITALVVRAS